MWALTDLDLTGFQSYNCNVIWYKDCFVEFKSLIDDMNFMKMSQNLVKHNTSINEDKTIRSIETK